jgi:hypothetical protein
VFSSIIFLAQVVSNLDSSLQQGSSIIAIRTPTVFAIAADGKGTFKGGNQPETVRRVSKIFESAGVIYAVGGLAKSPLGFDPAAIIAASVSSRRALADIANEVEREISTGLKDELIKLRAKEPGLYRSQLVGKNRGTNILLARWESDEPVAIAIRFVAELDKGGDDLVIQTQRLCCPGRDCPNGFFTFYLGHREPIDKYLSETPNFQMNPEEAVRFFVQLVIDSGAPDVGPPIDVVRIDADGIAWH